VESAAACLGYNACVPRRTFSNWNYELFRSEVLRQLWVGRGWLLTGALLQFTLALHLPLALQPGPRI